MLSGVVKTVFNSKELSTLNLSMPARSIETLFSGVYVLTPLLFGWTLICFAHDEDGSRYFGCPSLSGLCAVGWVVLSWLPRQFLWVIQIMLAPASHHFQDFPPPESFK